MVFDVRNDTVTTDNFGSRFVQQFRERKQYRRVGERISILEDARNRESYNKVGRLPTSVSTGSRENHRPKTTHGPPLIICQAQRVTLPANTVIYRKRPYRMTATISLAGQKACRNRLRAVAQSIVMPCASFHGGPSLFFVHHSHSVRRVII